MSDRPEYDPSYIKSKIFIENTQTHLVHLKTHYGVDLLDDTHFAQRFLSHIIFYKFSYELREAFKRELKEDCPSLAQIFDSYCKVITQLGNVKKEKALPCPSSKFNKSKSKSKFKKFSFNFKKTGSKFYPSLPFLSE